MDITNKELFELLGERYARAYEMRKNGLTYKAIGINLGVCRERAREIIAISERKLRNRGQ